MLTDQKIVLTKKETKENLAFWKFAYKWASGLLPTKLYVSKLRRVTGFCTLRHHDDSRLYYDIKSFRPTIDAFWFSDENGLVTQYLMSPKCQKHRVDFAMFMIKTLERNLEKGWYIGGNEYDA
jgi:hypothetical protein